MKLINGTNLLVPLNKGLMFSHTQVQGSIKTKNKKVQGAENVFCQNKNMY